MSRRTPSLQMNGQSSAAPSVQSPIVRVRKEGGEHLITPAGLTISFSLGAPMTVEQVSEGRRTVYVSSRGSMKVMVAGEPRLFRHREACDHALIALGDATASLRPRVSLRDDALSYVIEALLAEDAVGPTTHLFQEAVQEAALARLLALDDRAADQAPQSLPAAALSRVVEFLHANIATDLSIRDLAAVAGLSASHFSTLFRNATGEPPHRFHLRLRVEHARRLIEDGALPSAAALAAGFYDQSHLARHMRRILHTTPGTLARAFHAGAPRRPGETYDEH